MFGKKSQKNKFCPVCGTELKLEDSFCIKCGYSFVKRKKSRGINWKNILIFGIILIAIYIAIQYFTKQPIIPKQVSSFFDGFFSTNSTSSAIPKK